MNKKILIMNSKPHFEIGGMETYSKILIDTFLNKGYEVFELSQTPTNNIKYKNTNKNYTFVHHNFYKKNKFKNKKIFVFFEYINLLWISFKVNKIAKKLIQKHNIDVVIDNNFATKINFQKNVKYIWVQHFDWEIIKGKSFIRNFIKKVFFIKNRLTFPYIVVFTKKDVDLLKNNFFQKKSNVVSITPSITNFISENEISLKTNLNKNQIAFIGRLEDKQKNIAFLNEITREAKNNNQNINIHVYGDGPDKHLLENNPNIVLHGQFRHEDLKSILLNNIKVLLLPSKYEGFPFVVVEALSCGVPCIIANTFTNASYLINNSRGKLLNKFNPIDWLNEINKITNLDSKSYASISSNSIQFAKEILDINLFKNKWLKLVTD